MSNNTIPQKRLQSKTYEDGGKYGSFMLGVVSLGAMLPLTEAIFELSDMPVQTLSCLYRHLVALHEHGRDKEGVDLLHIIYGAFGIDYADAISLLRNDAEARSHFLYAFTADLREFLEEYPERRLAP